jgi:RNA polymerase sigma-70 factor (ECF subfamily)
MDDRQLEKQVRRAVEGDARAFGRIYDAYADRVFKFVRARVGSVHDAEDITETVFLKAYEAIGRYDSRGVPFGAWLFRIARNATTDHHRRRGRAPQTVEESHAETVAGPESVERVVLREIDAERLRTAVRALTDEQAEVIALRFFWGMSNRETAEALEKTEGAVKALQHRAIRSLERELAAEDGGGREAGEER